MEEKKQLNYFQYSFLLIKNPDEIITKDYKGFHKYGFFNMIILILAIFSNKLLEGLDYANEDPWYLRELYESITLTVSIAIPLGGIMLLMNWVATKVIDRRSLAYYSEKLGSVMFYPMIFYFITIILQLYNVSFYPLFSSLAMSFLYIGLFLVSYLFAARDNFKISALFVVGFYFISKIINLVI
ncbi:hypothetical protein [Evansella tamaricis]|uniref:Yip1 domain-containing protein n=1 Tax=Evansella tamaricis TaxID=2069301 RepID=A0ABS6JHE4_9BACI|nr:hypothetical protein [Evansella tamaricis]MBU9713084.1 hypothetical protein [Evansella tamaricis]